MEPTGLWSTCEAISRLGLGLGFYCTHEAISSALLSCARSTHVPSEELLEQKRIFKDPLHWSVQQFPQRERLPRLDPTFLKHGLRGCVSKELVVLCHCVRKLAAKQSVASKRFDCIQEAFAHETSRCGTHLLLQRSKKAYVRLVQRLHGMHVCACAGSVVEVSADMHCIT